MLQRFEHEQRKPHKRYVADINPTALGGFLTDTLVGTSAPSVYYTAAQVIAPEGGT